MADDGDSSTMLVVGLGRALVGVLRRADTVGVGRALAVVLRTLGELGAQLGRTGAVTHGSGAFDGPTRRRSTDGLR